MSTEFFGEISWKATEWKTENNEGK